MTAATKVALSLCAIALLGGCVSDLPLFPLTVTGSGLGRIKTIAVIPAAEPDYYVVENVGDDYPQVKVPPELIAAGDQRTLAGGRERFTKLIRQHSPAPVTLQAAIDIAERLKRLGYDARVEDGPGRATGSQSSIAPDTIKSDADAVLIMQLDRAGFWADGASDKYHPMLLFAPITLLGKDRTQVIYRRSHSCGPESLTSSVYWRRSFTQWEFVDFDQMISQPQLPAEALADCASAIAANVGDDLDPRLQ